MLLPVTLPDTTPALLLLAGPDTSPLAISLRLEADQVSGLTVREERRALAPHPVLRLRWRAMLPPAGAAGLRAGLLALGRTVAGAAGAAAALQPVLCPFWPAARLASEVDPGHFSSGLWAVWEPDGSRGAVGAELPVAGYVLTSLSLVAPVLQGRFEDWPEPTALTDQAAACDFAWLETGPLAVAWQVTAADAPAGPALHGRTWPVLPYAARHAEARAGGVVVEVDRQRLGYGRAEAETHYPQVPARRLALRQDLTTSEAAEVLRHWLACQGVVGPFWAPAATSPCRLAAAAGSSATTITVDDASALLGHAHVWLATAGGDQAARAVAGVAGNVLTLGSALGFTAAPATTLVQPLLFVRFDRSELAVEWRGGHSWRVDVGLRELPAEYGSPAGEVHGANLGPLAEPAWCYEITDGVQTWRRTSYAGPLILGGMTYAPHPIRHGELKERLSLEASEAVVELRDWPGSPFARYRLERTPAPLTVRIHEGVPDDGELTGSRVIWAGRVRSARWAGPVLTLGVGGFGTVLDQPSPRWLLAPSCSSELFNPAACGLDGAQWTFTGTRAHPQAAGYVHLLTGLAWRSGAALPDIGLGYFAGGYVVRTRAGAVDQLVGIVASGAYGAALELTLAALLHPAPTGAETWTLVPGCDGRVGTCRAKFDNLARFRGFPHMPAANPSITVRRKSSSGGKK